MKPINHSLIYPTNKGYFVLCLSDEEIKNFKYYTDYLFINDIDYMIVNNSQLWFTSLEDRTTFILACDE
jgi:hypothetical protein